MGSGFWGSKLSVLMSGIITTLCESSNRLKRASNFQSLRSHGLWYSNKETFSDFQLTAVMKLSKDPNFMKEIYLYKPKYFMYNCVVLAGLCIDNK